MPAPRVLLQVYTWSMLALAVCPLHASTAHGTDTSDTPGQAARPIYRQSTPTVAGQRVRGPPHNPNLRFFSVWSTAAGRGVGVNSSFVNFLFDDVDDVATLAGLRGRGFGPSLLHVRDVLFFPRHDPQGQ